MGIRSSKNIASAWGNGWRRTARTALTSWSYITSMDRKLILPSRYATAIAVDESRSASINTIDLTHVAMHYTRIAAFVLGAWLLGSVFLTFVATRNFATVDLVLKAPPAEASRMIQSLGSNNARQLLRYLAGEENRAYF